MIIFITLFSFFLLNLYYVHLLLDRIKYRFDRFESYMNIDEMNIIFGIALYTGSDYLNFGKKQI